MSGNKTNVLRWAKAGGPPPTTPADVPPSPKAAAALELLSPADAPGRRKIPLPIGSGSAYSGIPHSEMHKRIREAPVQRVPVEKLSSNGQRSVSEAGVARYFDRPRSRAKDQGGDHPVDKPIVVKSGGQHVTYDGHHRIAAAILKGETHIDARVVDLGDKPS